mgnify:CR=1 FL=1
MFKTGRIKRQRKKWLWMVMLWKEPKMETMGSKKQSDAPKQVNQDHLSIKSFFFADILQT